jgi:hypothetical protein
MEYKLKILNEKPLLGILVRVFNIQNSQLEDFIPEI